MNNDFLRFNNFDLKKDKDVVFSTHEATKPLPMAKEKRLSIYNFFADEISSTIKKPLFSLSKGEIKRPKLLDPLMFGAILLSVTAILFLLSLIIDKLVIVPLILIFLSILVPLTSVYFFFCLNTHKDIKVHTIIQLILSGVFAFICTYVISNGFTRTIAENSNTTKIVYAVVKMLFLLILLYISMRLLSVDNFLTVFLVSVSLSAGFSLAENAYELFSSMFLRIQILNDGISRPIGAILHSDEFWNISILNLFKISFINAIYYPVMLLMFTAINGFALRYHAVNSINEKGGASVSIYLLIILTTILSAFSTFETSMGLLEIIYKSVSALIAISVFRQVVDFSINREKFVE